jgi:hypothetical protein
MGRIEELKRMESPGKIGYVWYADRVGCHGEMK